MERGGSLRLLRRKYRMGKLEGGRMNDVCQGIGFHIRVLTIGMFEEMCRCTTTTQSPWAGNLEVLA